MCITAEVGLPYRVKYNPFDVRTNSTGWTWIRAAYLFIAIFVIVQSAFEGEWIGILLGAWPAVMGLFGLACPEKNCDDGNCNV
ncbi:hypothetical protein APR41_02955 [Salegentibacter salinarum]|uniref:Uncharacterized protein n=1 Tax=Salegentibacter salinarum TaxID=447422 RepID=A0A2N0TXV0_9FLAO|nr:hypothetical protein [Salegentibacter salinarum]PKD19580.1 hypothetical protein APR41_02955 [Salegentibacter salinarum]SKB42052.1 hypothetical protein SAMN05660903_00603 [Salegentibacter salinarum]